MKDAKILTKMSGSVILDTNVVIKFFGGDKSVVDNTVSSDLIYIPTIVFGELFYGAYNS
jgi:predicted nucleic acid-binding protein